MTRWTTEQLKEYETRRTSLLGKPKKKPSKYRNKILEVNGERFDSKHEYRKYLELKFMESAGLVRDIKRQVRYRIDVNGQHICDYIADFTYHDIKADALVVADAKSEATKKLPVYRLKFKLMKAVHGIEIVEV